MKNKGRETRLMGRPGLTTDEEKDDHENYIVNIKSKRLLRF